LAVLTILGEALKGVDANAFPEPLNSIIVYLQLFFGTAIAIFLVGLGRNISGYVTNYYKSELSEIYDINKYHTTIVYYLGFVTTVFAIVPPPYNQIAVAVLVVLDYVYSAYKTLKT